MMKSIPLIVTLVVAQALCALFFVVNIFSSVLGFAPINWQLSEFIELGAALGLILGVGLSGAVLYQTLRRNRVVEGQLKAASGAFMELLEARFVEWGLTAAETDVALFAIRGMSTVEIAGLRGVSEGTIKAQTNAIYRKAKVSGRPQLLSQFLDELVEMDPR